MPLEEDEIRLIDAFLLFLYIVFHLVHIRRHRCNPSGVSYCQGPKHYPGSHTWV